MQDTFGIIMLALVNGEPKILTLRQCLEEYIKHRKVVILRRTKFELDKAEASENPCNINHIKDIAIFAFIGLVISAGYVLVANMLDNTIKTEVDVEAAGLVVICNIPNYDAELKGKKGGKR
mgnify:CR=1 FL=1